jgi:glycine cleavage system H protein
VSAGVPETGCLAYARCRFETRLPLGRRYSRGHQWLLETEAGRWRIGLTAYALRLLGEIVECRFEVPSGSVLAPGTRLGWIEGFKTVSDLEAAAWGEVEACNEALSADITLLESDPYGAGWLYSVRGRPEPNTLSAAEYAALLDGLIDEQLARQEGDDTCR